MTDKIEEYVEELNVPSTDYTPDPMDQRMWETKQYLLALKFGNRTQYNKYNKQGRKFSDGIMKRLK